MVSDLVGRYGKSNEGSGSDHSDTGSVYAVFTDEEDAGDGEEPAVSESEGEESGDACEGEGENEDAPSDGLNDEEREIYSVYAVLTEQKDSEE